MPKITLLCHTPDPERVVAAAARLCYSAQGADGLLEGLTAEKAAQFLQMLMEMGHESPVEHVSFTFAIEGVSRSLLAQITRHRIASYSVQSQRYVRLSPFEYVTPPEIERNPEADAVFRRAMQTAAESYERIAQLLKEGHARAFAAQGMSEAESLRAAEKMALEDARFVLPNACETRLVITMNARSLLNFFRQRCCLRAQWEIRQTADEMLSLVKKAAPALFCRAGPPCVAGPCPEGKMSCGKAVEMRAKYKGESQ
jgi:thymidylate synthase (FAD)